jgi:hypothetical protein
VSPIDGDGLIDAEGLTEADGLIEAEGDKLGLIDGDKLADGIFNN